MRNHYGTMLLFISFFDIREEALELAPRGKYAGGVLEKNSMMDEPL